MTVLRRLGLIATAALLAAACTGAPVSAPTTGPTPGATVAASSASTPPPTPAPTPATSVTAAPSAGPATDVCADDWDTSPASCDADIGDRLVFACPPGGEPTAIYGTDTYTDDSSACVAAVHAGLITYESGGTVVVELVAGLDSYPASERNGVSSSGWGSWPVAFVFVGSGPGPGPTDAPATGAPTGEMAELLAHVPPAFNVGCHEVTTLSAGEVIAAQCTPDFIDGYVTYVLFETESDAMDKWLGDLDYFGEGVETGDCSAGPCIDEWIGANGLVEGRYLANHYSGIVPDGLIAYWFDAYLRIEAGIVLHSGTFADLHSLALQAGPIAP